MEATHSEVPWHIAGKSILDARGNTVTQISNWVGLNERHAVFVVNCVNAHHELIAILERCDQELSILNAKANGRERNKSPAARLILDLNALLDKIVGA